MKLDDLKDMDKTLIGGERCDALIYGTENTCSGKTAVISLQKFMLSVYRAKGDENYKDF